MYNKLLWTKIGFKKEGKEKEDYIVWRSLRFPIAGAISPSRFKPDRLLQWQKQNKHQFKEGKTKNQETYTTNNGNDQNDVI